MLIRATVENFKSFDEREELSLIASGQERTTERFKNDLVKAGGIKLLKKTAIYGANAAGKSCLVSFFSFIRNALLPHDADYELECDDYCRNKPENKERESLFEIQFSADDELYTYGFTVVLSEGRITEEWLGRLFPRNNDVSLLFTRKGGEEPRIGESVNLNPESPDGGRFRTYANDFINNDSLLFLSEMNRGKSFEADSKLSFFKRVYDWIMKDIIVITPRVSISSSGSFVSEEYMRKLIKTMKDFGTGIDDIEMRKMSDQEIQKMVPLHVYREAFRRIDASHEHRLICENDTGLYIFSIDDDGKKEVSMVTLKHEGTESEFDFSDESDGTRRLFGLVDILITDRPDSVYIVDELERSFHPKLTEHFIRSFIDNHAGVRTQLVMATHENTIMNRDLFRRDEIWFVDKNKKGMSKLYPLDYFEDMHGDDFGRDYLDGRFGAVPVLR